MNDVSGEAMLDFYNKTTPAKLWIHNRYGPKEDMPVEIYFRTIADMPPLEQLALQQCKGSVLDAGAGAGSHALVLQQMGLPVTALDLSPGAVAVMQQRGVQRVIEQDIFDYTGAGFDTVLMLMNGIGFTGTVNRLQQFLQHAKTLINKGGQLLFDSSDVAYLYEETALPAAHYYGEIEYRYQYKKLKTGWFKWLYIDKKQLLKTAAATGWKLQLLLEDEYGQYLVRLTLA